MKKDSRVAIYTRVSTDDKGQSTANQKAALLAWAKNAGHTIVNVYEDLGISGVKSRDKRPAFDAMLKDAVRGEFDILAVWSSDRLGRSLKNLVEVLETIRATGCGLYIHTQAVDTTTPAGRALFGMLAIFAEFEHEMIRERVKAGMASIKDKLARDGKFTSRVSGKVRTRLGRPAPKAEKLERARLELAKGIGIGKVAREVGLGVGTVHRLKREIRGHAAYLEAPAAPPLG
jgi:DNA invertase Pin-like site-specific DNA recombinase